MLSKTYSATRYNRLTLTTRSGYDIIFKSPLNSNKILVHRLLETGWSHPPTLLSLAPCCKTLTVEISTVLQLFTLTSKYKIHVIY